MFYANGKNSEKFTEIFLQVSLLLFLRMHGSSFLSGQALRVITLGFNCLVGCYNFESANKRF